MHYFAVSEYSETQFQRLTGVKREVFDLMVLVVREQTRCFGRPRKLSVEDQLLLSLCYWREYRSQFHVASSFGVSEATVCRTVRKIEEALLRDERFHLPGKKALRGADVEWSVLVVDASEQRIERPQKNSASSTLARRSATPKSGKS